MVRDNLRIDPVQLVLMQQRKRQSPQSTLTRWELADVALLGMGAAWLIGVATGIGIMLVLGGRGL